MKHVTKILVAAAAQTLAVTAAHADTCLDLGVTLCGDWADAGGEYHAEGALTVDTPMGPIVLANADVTATTDPPSLRGAVNLPLPNLGVLADAGITGSSPRAEIALGSGAALEALEIEGQPMALDPDDTYLMFDYEGLYRLSMGPVSLSAGRRREISTLVLGPNEPLMYVGGDLSELFPGNPIRNVAIGVSFDGRLPWQSENPLWDGESLAPMDLTGHLLVAGNVRLGRYPIVLHGHAIFDLDADDDGQTVFDGDAGDVRLGADAALDVSVSAGPLSVDVPLGAASVVYDGTQGSDGAAYFYAEDGGNCWEGTPLDFIQPAGAGQQIVYGYYRETDDFAVHYEREAAILGFPAGRVEAELGTDGAWVHATLQSRDMLPEVDLEGEVRGFDDFELTGTADVQIAGFTIGGATITAGSNGLRLRGEASLPHVGSIQLAGAFSSNGRASVTGHADVSLGGFELADAEVTVNRNGMRIAGRIDLGALGSANIAGAVQANGQFSLDGAITLDLFGLDVANTRVTLNNEGARLSGRVNIGVGSFDVEGAATTNGYFTLRGTVDLNVGGIELAGLSASVSRRRGNYSTIFGTTQVADVVEVSISGGVDIPFAGGVNLSGGLRMSDNILVSRPFKLTGTANVSLPGVDLANAQVVVSTSKVSLAGRVKFAGARLDVSGRIYSDGGFTLRGSVDVGADVSIAGTGVTAGGEMEVTVERSGTKFKASADFDGEVCGKISYVFGSVKECAHFGVGVSSSGNICVDIPLLGNQCIDIW